MEPLPEQQTPAPDSDSDSEENGAMFLEKRALNIKENKAMASISAFLDALPPPSPPPQFLGVLFG